MQCVACWMTVHLCLAVSAMLHSATATHLKQEPWLGEPRACRCCSLAAWGVALLLEGWTRRSQLKQALVKQALLVWGRLQWTNAQTSPWGLHCAKM